MDTGRQQPDKKQLLQQQQLLLQKQLQQHQFLKQQQQLLHSQTQSQQPPQQLLQTSQFQPQLQTQPQFQQQLITQQQILRRKQVMQQEHLNKQQMFQDHQKKQEQALPELFQSQDTNTDGENHQFVQHPRPQNIQQQQQVYMQQQQRQQQDQHMQLQSLQQKQLQSNFQQHQFIQQHQIIQQQPEPQIVQPSPQMIQQSQVIKQPQILQKSHLIQPQIIQQSYHIQQPQIVQKSQLVQQSQHIKQPQIIQQSQIVQQQNQYTNISSQQQTTKQTPNTQQMLKQQLQQLMSKNKKPRIVVLNNQPQQQQFTQQPQRVQTANATGQQQMQCVVVTGAGQQQPQQGPRMIFTGPSQQIQQLQQVVIPGSSQQLPQQIQNVLNPCSIQQQPQQKQRVIVSGACQQQQQPQLVVVNSNSSGQQNQQFIQQPQVQQVGQRFVIGQLKASQQTQQIQSPSQRGMVLNQLQQPLVQRPITVKQQQQRVVIANQQQLLKLPQQQSTQSTLLQQQLAQLSNPKQQKLQNVQQHKVTQQSPQNVVITQQQHQKSNVKLSDQNLVQQLYVKQSHQQLQQFHIQTPQKHVQQNNQQQLLLPKQPIQQQRNQKTEQQQEQVEQTLHNAVIVEKLPRSARLEPEQLQQQFKKQQEDRQKLDSHLKLQQQLKQKKHQQQKRIEENKLKQKHEEYKLREQVLLQQHLKKTQQHQLQQELLTTQDSSENRKSLVIVQHNEDQQNTEKSTTNCEKPVNQLRILTKDCSSYNNVTTDEDNLVLSSSSDDDEDNDILKKQRHLYREAEHLVRERYKELSIALGHDYQVYYDAILRNWLLGELSLDEYDREMRKVFYVSWALRSMVKDNDKNISVFTNGTNTHLTVTDSTTITSGNTFDSLVTLTSKTTTGVESLIPNSKIRTASSIPTSNEKNAQIFSTTQPITNVKSIPWINNLIKETDTDIKIKEAIAVLGKRLPLHNEFISSLAAWLPHYLLRLERRSARAQGITETGHPLRLYTYLDLPQAHGYIDHWYPNVSGSLVRWFWPNRIPCSPFVMDNKLQQSSSLTFQEQERIEVAGATVAAILLGPPPYTDIPSILQQHAIQKTIEYNHVTQAKQPSQCEKSYPIKFNTYETKWAQWLRLKEQKKLDSIILIRDKYAKLLHELKAKGRKLKSYERRLIKRLRQFQDRMLRQRCKTLAQFKLQLLETQIRIRKRFDRSWHELPEKKYQQQLHTKTATVTNIDDEMDKDEKVYVEDRQHHLLKRNLGSLEVLQKKCEQLRNNIQKYENQLMPYSTKSSVQLLYDKQKYWSSYRILLSVRKQYRIVQKYADRLRELRYINCPCGVSDRHSCIYQKQMYLMRKQLKVCDEKELYPSVDRNVEENVVTKNRKTPFKKNKLRSGKQKLGEIKNTVEKNDKLKINKKGTLLSEKNENSVIIPDYGKTAVTNNNTANTITTNTTCLSSVNTHNSIIRGPEILESQTKDESHVKDITKHGAKVNYMPSLKKTVSSTRSDVLVNSGAHQSFLSRNGQNNHVNVADAATRAAEAALAAFRKSRNQRDRDTDKKTNKFKPSAQVKKHQSMNGYMKLQGCLKELCHKHDMNQVSNVKYQDDMGQGRDVEEKQPSHYLYVGGSSYSSDDISESSSFRPLSPLLHDLRQDQLLPIPVNKRWSQANDELHSFEPSPFLMHHSVKSSVHKLEIERERNQRKLFEDAILNAGGHSFLTSLPGQSLCKISDSANCPVINKLPTKKIKKSNKTIPLRDDIELHEQLHQNEEKKQQQQYSDKSEPHHNQKRSDTQSAPVNLPPSQQKPIITIDLTSEDERTQKLQTNEKTISSRAPAQKTQKELKKTKVSSSKNEPKKTKDSSLKSEPIRTIDLSSEDERTFKLLESRKTIGSWSASQKIQNDPTKIKSSLSKNEPRKTKGSLLKSESIQAINSPSEDERTLELLESRKIKGSWATDTKNQKDPRKTIGVCLNTEKITSLRLNKEPEQTEMEEQPNQDSYKNKSRTRSKRDGRKRHKHKTISTNEQLPLPELEVVEEFQSAKWKAPLTQSNKRPVAFDENISMKYPIKKSSRNRKIESSKSNKIKNIEELGPLDRLNFPRFNHNVHVLISEYLQYIGNLPQDQLHDKILPFIQVLRSSALYAKYKSIINKLLELQQKLVVQFNKQNSSTKLQKPLFVDEQGKIILDNLRHLLSEYGPSQEDIRQSTAAAIHNEQINVTVDQFINKVVADDNLCLWQDLWPAYEDKQNEENIVFLDEEYQLRHIQQLIDQYHSSKNEFEQKSLPLLQQQNQQYGLHKQDSLKNELIESRRLPKQINMQLKSPVLERPKQQSPVKQQLHQCNHKINCLQQLKELEHQEKLILKQKKNLYQQTQKRHELQEQELPLLDRQQNCKQKNVCGNIKLNDPAEWKLGKFVSQSQWFNPLRPLREQLFNKAVLDRIQLYLRKLEEVKQQPEETEQQLKEAKQQPTSTNDDSQVTTKSVIPENIVKEVYHGSWKTHRGSTLWWTEVGIYRKISTLVKETPVKSSAYASTKPISNTRQITIPQKETNPAEVITKKIIRNKLTVNEKDEVQKLIEPIAQSFWTANEQRCLMLLCNSIKKVTEETNLHWDAMVRLQKERTGLVGKYMGELDQKLQDKQLSHTSHPVNLELEPCKKSVSNEGSNRHILKSMVIGTEEKIDMHPNWHQIDINRQMHQRYWKMNLLKLHDLKFTKNLINRHLYNLFEERYLRSCVENQYVSMAMVFMPSKPLNIADKQKLYLKLEQLCSKTVQPKKVSQKIIEKPVLPKNITKQKYSSQEQCKVQQRNKKIKGKLIKQQKLLQKSTEHRGISRQSSTRPLSPKIREETEKETQSKNKQESQLKQKNQPKQNHQRIRKQVTFKPKIEANLTNLSYLRELMSQIELLKRKHICHQQQLGVIKIDSMDPQPKVLQFQNIEFFLRNLTYLLHQQITIYQNKLNALNVHNQKKENESLASQQSITSFHEPSINSVNLTSQLPSIKSVILKPHQPQLSENLINPIVAALETNKRESDILEMEQNLKQQLGISYNKLKPLMKLWQLSIRFPERWLHQQFDGLKQAIQAIDDPSRIFVYQPLNKNRRNKRLTSVSPSAAAYGLWKQFLRVREYFLWRWQRKQTLINEYLMALYRENMLTEQHSTYSMLLKVQPSMSENKSETLRLTLANPWSSKEKLSVSTCTTPQKISSVPKLSSHNITLKLQNSLMSTQESLTYSALLTLTKPFTSKEPVSVVLIPCQQFTSKQKRSTPSMTLNSQLSPLKQKLLMLLKERQIVTPNPSNYLSVTTCNPISSVNKQSMGQFNNIKKLPKKRLLRDENKKNDSKRLKSISTKKPIMSHNSVNCEQFQNVQSMHHTQINKLPNINDNKNDIIEIIDSDDEIPENEYLSDEKRNIILKNLTSKSTSKTDIDEQVFESSISSELSMKSSKINSIQSSEISTLDDSRNKLVNNYTVDGSPENVGTYKINSNFNQGRCIARTIITDIVGLPMPIFRDHGFINGTVEEVVHSRFMTTILSMEAASSIESYIPSQKLLPSFKNITSPNYSVPKPINSNNIEEYNINSKKTSVSANTTIPFSIVMDRIEKFESSKNINPQNGCARISDSALKSAARKARIPEGQTNAFTTRPSRPTVTKVTPLDEKSMTTVARPPIKRSMSAIVTTNSITDSEQFPTPKRSASVAFITLPSYTVATSSLPSAVGQHKISKSTVTTTTIDKKKGQQSAIQPIKRSASVAFSSISPLSSKNTPFTDIPTKMSFSSLVTTTSPMLTSPESSVKSISRSGAIKRSKSTVITTITPTENTATVNDILTLMTSTSATVTKTINNEAPKTAAIINETKNVNDHSNMNMNTIKEEIRLVKVKRTTCPTVSTSMDVTADACKLVVSACEDFVRAMVMERMSKTGRGIGTLELRRRDGFHAAIAADEDIRPTPEYCRTTETMLYPSSKFDLCKDSKKLLVNQQKQQKNVTTVNEHEDEKWIIPDQKRFNSKQCIIMDDKTNKPKILTIETVVETKFINTTTTANNKQYPTLKTVSAIKVQPSSSDHTVSETSARTSGIVVQKTARRLLPKSRMATIKNPSVVNNQQSKTITLTSNSKEPMEFVTTPLTKKQSQTEKSSFIITETSKTPSYIGTKTLDVIIPESNSSINVVKNIKTSRGFFIERGRPLLRPPFQKCRPFGTIGASSILVAAEASVKNNATHAYFNNCDMELDARCQTNDEIGNDVWNFVEECDGNGLPSVSRLSSFLNDNSAEYDNVKEKKLSKCQQQVILEVFRQQQRHKQLAKELNQQVHEYQSHLPESPEMFHQKFLKLQFESKKASPKLPQISQPQNITSQQGLVSW